MSELATFLENSVGDPRFFVLGAFEWGLNDLAPSAQDPNPGPDSWQMEILGLIASKHLSIADALQIAVSSGNGPGKTALIAWIVLWFACTKPHGNGMVTANTKNQLETKTWREVGLWYKRLIEPLRDRFELTATKLYHRDHERTWFIHAVPWSENNPDAFAGMHAEWVLMVFDEASNIAKVIWEAAKGCMTTPHAIWIAFGNPWRNSGGFHECFHAQRHRWHLSQVDSRNAKRANKQEIQKWIDDYGEDSDYVRIHVRGVFPRAGTLQLIASDVIEGAQARFKLIGKLEPKAIHPAKKGAKILGVDVARFGSNASTIWYREGRYARRLLKAHGLDTMQLAARVSEFINEIKPAAAFVDGAGVGGGVIDRLYQLGHTGVVIEVNSGTRAMDPAKYGNLRAEMWEKMAQWLQIGALEDDLDIRTDLSSPEYFYDRSNRKMLESKEDMMSRGIGSPDDADALANTFAMPVAEPEHEDRYAVRDRYNKQGARHGSPLAA